MEIWLFLNYPGWKPLKDTAILWLHGKGGRDWDLDERWTFFHQKLHQPLTL
jgi:hypothetical protein